MCVCTEKQPVRASPGQFIVLQDALPSELENGDMQTQIFKYTHTIVAATRCLQNKQTRYAQQTGCTILTGRSSYEMQNTG
jgi:hypothetical protein